MKKLTERGTKAVQLSLSQSKDRIKDFSEYFYNPPVHLGYVSDIDFIFYEYRDRVLMDYALVEVTKTDSVVTENLLKAIHENFYTKGGQANFVKHKSRALNIPACLVVYHDLNELYVWSFQEENRWKKTSLLEFTYYLAALRNKKLIRTYKKESNADGAIS